MPKTFEKGQPGIPDEIEPGDRIRISVPSLYGGRAWSGEGMVRTAYHWDDRSGWYIEFDCDWEQGHGIAPAYRYWKQGADGGSVELLPTADELAAHDLLTGITAEPLQDLISRAEEEEEKGDGH